MRNTIRRFITENCVIEGQFVSDQNFNTLSAADDQPRISSRRFYLSFYLNINTIWHINDISKIIFDGL